MEQQTQYMNRELDEKFGDIKTQLDRIEGQTIKTNGRVTSLEVDTKVFRARIYTAVSIISFIVGSMLVPLIAAFLVGVKL